MAVISEAAGSGLKEQAYRRGGCRSRRNMSQLVVADGDMTPELVVCGQEEGALPLVAVLKRQTH